MGTYALSAGYYDAYYKRAQQVSSRFFLNICLFILITLNGVDYYVDHGNVVVQVRTVVQKSFKAALDEHDILISPAAPSAAYKIGCFTFSSFLDVSVILYNDYLSLCGMNIYR